MANYHLYYLRDHQIIGSDSIEAVDDKDAVRLAKELGWGQAIEVWNAHSRIRVVAPARASVDTAPVPQSKHSLEIEGRVDL